MQEPTYAGGICKCGHHKIVPVLIILFGVNLLLTQLGVFGPMAFGIIASVLIILAGIMKFMKGSCKCCPN